MIIPEISAAVTSARAIGDVFKGIVSLSMDSRVKEAVIDAQNIALQLQQQMFDVLAKFEGDLLQISNRWNSDDN